MIYFLNNEVYIFEQCIYIYLRYQQVGLGGVEQKNCIFSQHFCFLSTPTPPGPTRAPHDRGNKLSLKFRSFVNYKVNLNVNKGKISIRY